MSTSSDCTADLIGPVADDLAGSVDALYDKVAAEFAAPLVRLARAYEVNLTTQQNLLQDIHLAV